ncbi:unnamed protein product [Kuraishia capsulata CBS 1993]|uniref:C2H2-type domain-containing protein n=1 Tax=Kuraishia capsulata CBS 1993 TaxID=1382522 RepID=W6MLP7_9ASCO|nr:uncharacterized protein KUCA_T00003404001 [Kuraishia capsulata CBS 1993]CDK27426.1 unnamed protein product [Kuraishia capsulata CBS 1993]
MDSLISSDHSPRRDHIDYHHLESLQTYTNDFMDLRQNGLTSEASQLHALLNGNPTLAKSYSWSHSDLDLGEDDVVPASNNSGMHSNLQFPPVTGHSMGMIHMNDPNLTTAKGLLPFGSISESLSNSTISSYDSIPPGLSSSVSNSFSGHSLHTSSDPNIGHSSQEDPLVSHTVLSTPVRTTVARRRSSTLTSGSNGPNTTLITATPQSASNTLYQTPIKRSSSFTPRRRSHARTRSRLSMDASHAMGTNPFYTPPSFLSPKLESPMSQTPIDLFSSHPPVSISPQMLMKSDTILSTPVQEEYSHQNDDGAPGMRRLRAKKLASEPLLSHMSYGNSGMHQESVNPSLVMFQTQQPIIDTQLLSRSHSSSLLVDPENTESFSAQPQHRPSLVGSVTMGSIPQPHNSSFLQRSRSSINLSAIALSKESSIASRNMNISMNPAANLPYSRSGNSFDLVQQQTPPPTAMSGSKSTPSIKAHVAAPVVVTPVRGHRRAKSSVPNVPMSAEDELKAKKKIHECPICHNKFQRPEHVKRHMRSHSSEKPYECPLDECGKKFNRKDNLKQHLRKIHGMTPTKEI